MSAASGIQITSLTVTQRMCYPYLAIDVSILLELRWKPTIWSARDTSILDQIPMIRFHFEIVSDESLAASVD